MEFAVRSNAIVNTVVIRTVMINDSYCIVFLCLEYFFLFFVFFCFEFEKGNDSPRCSLLPSCSKMNEIKKAEWRVIDVVNEGGGFE